MPLSVEYLILHCTDSPWGSVDSIREYHTKPKEKGGRGWRDIGYAFVVGNCYPTLESFHDGRPVIENDGQVWKGRDLDKDGDVEEEVGAHVQGWNHKSLGIALVGRVKHFGQFAGGGFTSEQIRSALRLCGDLCHRHAVPFSKVLGHYETGAPKSCPDIDCSWFREQLKRAA